MNRKEKPLIVRATKVHLDQICTLEQQIFGKNDAFPRSQLRYLINSQNTAFFIALKSGLPIGYGIALKNRLRNGKLKGRIYSLGVARKYQGQGVGSTLLDALENWLLVERVTFITLETKATKGGARDFFKGKGYRVTEFLPGYYEPSDGLRMMKSRMPLSRVQPSRPPLARHL